jgi:cardiolipin synthase
MRAWAHAANLLTLARLLCAPWLAWLLIHNNYPWAFWLLVACGLSDAGDGWLARRWRLQSSAGALLDPIADKVLLVTLYLALGFNGAMPLWMTALVLLRDLAILALAAAALLFTRIREFPPSSWGKICTFFQFLFAGGVLLYGLASALVPPDLMTILLGATVTATLWSGFDYLRIALHRFHRNNRIDAAPAPR